MKKRDHLANAGFGETLEASGIGLGYTREGDALSAEAVAERAGNGWAFDLPARRAMNAIAQNLRQKKWEKLLKLRIKGLTLPESVVILLLLSLRGLLAAEDTVSDFAKGVAHVRTSGAS